MADAGKLDFLFNPRSIAVVGATDSKGKLASIIMDSLENAGFKGKIYPVNQSTILSGEGGVSPT